MALSENRLPHSIHWFISFPFSDGKSTGYGESVNPLVPIHRYPLAIINFPMKNDMNWLCYPWFMISAVHPLIIMLSDPLVHPRFFDGPKT
jgi:hypothetical protein